jgi:hypothetical protein
VRDELVAADGLVELSDRPRESGAAGRERFEAERGQQAGGADVPWIRHHEELLCGV